MTPRVIGLPEAEQPPSSSDAGFTLIELMVAIGVFSVLMVIVGAATLSGFSAIREATSRSSIQQESQNAMEWTSKLLRYASVPDGQTTSLPTATATSVMVYTYSGTGSKEDVPYRARIRAKASADGGTTVISEVWTPTKTLSGWTWPDILTTNPALVKTRELLTIPPGVAGSALGLKYYACTPTAGCLATRRLVTPNASGPLTLGALEVPESIIVSIGDPSLPGSMVTQAVKLVNLA
jgi:prepilin-type N-terminal cleavage/methylation domain-containing protein